MLELPLTEHQWISMFFFQSEELIEWFRTQEVEVPEIKGLVFERKAVFTDPVSAVAFKMRWL